MKDKYLNVDKLLDMVQCYDEYYRDNIYDEIEFNIERERKINYFENTDDGYRCNISGAKHILTVLGLDEREYSQTLDYLKKDDFELDGIKLNTELDICVNGKDEQACIDGKKFIENICLGICTNGKGLDEIDTSKLRKRDINTINNAVKRYEDMVKAGHKSNAKKLCSVYDYVNDNDPDICRRMLYYYDYDPIDLGDFKDRYNFMDYKEIRKALNKCFKKDKKKRKKNKKNK